MFSPSRDDHERNQAVAHVLQALTSALESNDLEFLNDLASKARQRIRKTHGSSPIYLAQDRHEQLSSMAFLFEAYVRKNVPPTEMAKYFLLQILQRGSPLQLEIEGLGASLRSADGFTVDEAALAKVQRAFEKEHERDQRGRDVEALAERYIEKGLAAVGHPGARDVFSFRSKRVSRSSN